MNKINLSGLARAELIELQAEIKIRLKQFIAFRIRERVVTCGVKTCFCQDGVDGHGPYLYAAWQEDGKRKTRSLGVKFTPQDFDEWNIDYPHVADYLRIPDHKYQEMSVAQTSEMSSFTLDREQFFNRYGVAKDKDNLGRSDKFWGFKDDLDRYYNDCSLALEIANVPSSRWAVYGVGTLEAIAILDQMVDGDYYLK